MNGILCKGNRVDNGELVKGYYMPRPNLSKEYIVSVGNAVWHEVKPDTVMSLRNGGTYDISERIETQTW